MREGCRAEQMLEEMGWQLCPRLQLSTAETGQMPPLCRGGKLSTDHRLPDFIGRANAETSHLQKGSVCLQGEIPALTVSTCPEAGSAGSVSQQRPRDKRDAIDTPLISFAELWSLITRREQNTHGLPGLHLRRGEQEREGTGTVQLPQHPGCCTSTALFPAEGIKHSGAFLEQDRRSPLCAGVSRGKRNFAAFNNRLLKCHHFPLKHVLGLLSTDTVPGSLMGPKGQNLSSAASNPWGTRIDSHQHLHRPVQGQPSSPGYIKGKFKDKIALIIIKKKRFNANMKEFNCPRFTFIKWCIFFTCFQHGNKHYARSVSLSSPPKLQLWF